MRILMIGVNSKMKGGIASVVNSYYEYGIDKKYNFKYLESVKFRNKVMNIFWYIISVIKFLSIINKYDIVHIHMASRGSFYRKSIYVIISKFFKKKLIIHLHGAEFIEFYSSNHKFIQKYIRMIFLKADRVIALSNTWKKNLSENKIVRDEKVIVIRNAVKIPEKKIKNYDKANIVFLGRIGSRKGIYDILEALKEVELNYKCIIAGDGEISKVKNIILENNLNEKIEVIGWIDKKKKEKILCEANIFILPSYNEGLPMALLESMAEGCVPIVSNVGGIPEVIVNGENGYLINAGDKVKLKFKIEKLVLSIEKRREMGIKARNTIEREFDLTAAMEILNKTYNELIK